MCAQYKDKFMAIFRSGQIPKPEDFVNDVRSSFVPGVVSIDGDETPTKEVSRELRESFNIIWYSLFPVERFECLDHALQYLFDKKVGESIVYARFRPLLLQLMDHNDANMCKRCVIFTNSGRKDGENREQFCARENLKNAFFDELYHITNIIGLLMIDSQPAIISWYGYREEHGPQYVRPRGANCALTFVLADTPPTGPVMRGRSDAQKPIDGMVEI